MMLRPQKRPTESNILSVAAKVWSRSELNLIIAVINCLDIQTIFKAVFFNLKAIVLKGVDDMYTKYLVTGATGFLGILCLTVFPFFTVILRTEASLMKPSKTQVVNIA